MDRSADADRHVTLSSYPPAAKATIQRFPDVPVEGRPIEEFTYLQPSRWNGTRSTERMPHLERY